MVRPLPEDEARPAELVPLHQPITWRLSYRHLTCVCTIAARAGSGPPRTPRPRSAGWHDDGPLHPPRSGRGAQIASQPSGRVPARSRWVVSVARRLLRLRQGRLVRGAGQPGGPAFRAESGRRWPRRTSRVTRGSARNRRHPLSTHARSTPLRAWVLRFRPLGEASTRPPLGVQSSDGGNRRSARQPHQAAATRPDQYRDAPPKPVPPGQPTSTPAATSTPTATARQPSPPRSGRRPRLTSTWSRARRWSGVSLTISRTRTW